MASDMEEVDEFDHFLDERLEGDEEEELELLLRASENQDQEASEHEAHDTKEKQVVPEDEMVVVDFDLHLQENDALSASQVDQKLQQMLSSSEGSLSKEQKGKKQVRANRPLSRDFLVQEVVDARVTALISGLLNKFGTVISVPSRDELKKRVEEAVQKELGVKKNSETKASDDSEGSETAPKMLTLADLTTSLQRKTVLMEQVVDDLAAILEKSAKRHVTLRRQRTELRKYCVTLQDEIKRSHEEIWTEKRKCSRLRKARQKEHQFLLQEIEQHRQTIAQLTESDPPPAPDMSKLNISEDIGEDSDEEFSITSALSKTVLGSVLGWTQPQQGATSSSSSSSSSRVPTTSNTGSTDEDTASTASQTPEAAPQQSQTPQSLHHAAESVSSVLSSFSTWWSSGSTSATAPTPENRTATHQYPRQREPIRTKPPVAVTTQLRLEQRRPPASFSQSQEQLSQSASPVPAPAQKEVQTREAKSSAGTNKD